MIRLPGICNGNPETTVLAHYRMLPYNGTGIKPPDWMGAFACSQCHDYIDGRKSRADQRYDSLRLAHAEGVFRTMDALIKMGLITIGKRGIA
jgi:hypothetical protein